MEREVDVAQVLAELGGISTRPDYVRRVLVMVVALVQRQADLACPRCSAA